MDPIRILFIEDRKTDVELAEHELAKEGIQISSHRVEMEEELRKALKTFCPDLIICDYSMPQFDGLEALKIIKNHDEMLPVIMFTGTQNEEVAVECMKLGAVDYILKDNITRMPFAIKEALERKKASAEVKMMNEEVTERSRELEKANTDLLAARDASLNLMQDLLVEIEERNQAEASLHESEGKYRELVENLNDVAYSVSLDGTINYVSPSSLQILGLCRMKSLVCISQIS